MRYVSFTVKNIPVVKTQDVHFEFSEEEILHPKVMEAMAAIKKMSDGAGRAEAYADLGRVISSYLFCCVSGMMGSAVAREYGKHRWPGH